MPNQFFKNALEENHRPYILLKGNKEERFNTATEAIDKIIKKTKQIFKSEFNQKMLRTQLAYFKDIDYSEKVIYTKGFKVENEIIRKELIKISLS